MQFESLGAGKASAAAKLCRDLQARITVFEGSVRSGKTITSLVAWLDIARNAPPGGLLMAGRTERTLKRNVIEPLQEMIGSSRCVHNIGTGELNLLGRKIFLSSANDERSATKIAGLTLAGAYCDEMTLMPESFFRMLTSRLSVPGARLVGTTNPDSPLHWLKAAYLDRPRVHLTQAGDLLLSQDEDPLDLARLSFILADNPHLPPDYIKALTLEYSGLWYRRYILGEWVVAEGSVYDMFDPDRHVVDVLPVIKRWLCCSVDYGTTNPFDAILIGLGVDRRLYAIAEWRWDSAARHRQLTDMEYSAKLGEWLGSVRHPGSQLHGVTPERIVLDPSATSFRAQLFHDRYQPHLADNEVLDGIRQVSSLLASGRLLIHSSCKYLIDELQSYSWDPKAAARGEDAPIKVNDHSSDALRYGIYTTRQIWRNLIIPPEAPTSYQDTFGVPL